LTLKKLTDNQRHLALVFAPITICILLLVVIELRDDPSTIEASRGDKDLEFTALPESQRVYRVLQRRSGERAFFTLSTFSDEKLIAPVQSKPCQGFVPEWVPRFPNAVSTACLAIRTNLSDSRLFSSFLVNADDSGAVYEFYRNALAGSTGFSELANGTLPTTRPPDQSSDISAVIEYKDVTGATRLTMDYYLASPFRQTVVVMEFLKE
jgi:hypothetical protein